MAKVVPPNARRWLCDCRPARPGGNRKASEEGVNTVAFNLALHRDKPGGGVYSLSCRQCVDN